MSMLGVTINLLRHGFGPVPNRQFAMRISGNGPFKVELRPLEHMQGRGRENVTFRAWWSQEICRCEMMAFINDIKPIRGIIKVKRPIEFYINDQGELAP